MIRILSVIAGCLLWWSGLANAVPFTLQDNGLKGLERATIVAGEHGRQGRDKAAFHRDINVPQNMTFATGLHGMLPSTNGRAALVSPTTVPSRTSQATSVPPEPSSLLLLGAAFAGLGMWQFRKRKT